MEEQLDRPPDDRAADKRSLPLDAIDQVERSQFLHDPATRDIAHPVFLTKLFQGVETIPWFEMAMGQLIDEGCGYLLPEHGTAHL